MPDLSLKIVRGRLSLMRDGQTVLSLANLEAVLAFAPEPQKGQGRSERTSDDHYYITGKAQAVISEAAALPGPLRISIARFDAYPKNLVVAQSRARLLDMDMSFSGSVEDYLSAAPRSDIVFSGSIGQDASYWIRILAGLPEKVMIRTPLRVRDVRLRSSGRLVLVRVADRQRNGKGRHCDLFRSAASARSSRHREASGEGQ
jgi:hypothetical protein